MQKNLIIFSFFATIVVAMTITAFAAYPNEMRLWRALSDNAGAIYARFDIGGLKQTWLDITAGSTVPDNTSYMYSDDFGWVEVSTGAGLFATTTVANGGNFNLTGSMFSTNAGEINWYDNQNSQGVKLVKDPRFPQRYYVTNTANNGQGYAYSNDFGYLDFSTPRKISNKPLF